MTLVELAFACALMAIIGLALYAGLGSGLRVWEKVRAPFPEEDAAVFFEKFSADASNALPYPSLPLEGTAVRLALPTIVRDGLAYPQTGQGIGVVEYLYDNESRQLFRSQRTLSAVFQGQPMRPARVLENLTECVFSYFGMDRDLGQPAWFSQWPVPEGNVTAGLPLAVRVVLAYTMSNKTEEYVKTVFLTTAQP